MGWWEDKFNEDVLDENGSHETTYIVDLSTSRIRGKLKTVS